MRIPHITDALGLLAYFFCGYAAFLVVWTIWKRARPKHAERWMRFLLSVRTKRDKLNDGIANWWAPIFAFSFCAVLISVPIYLNVHLPYVKEIHHHVKVLKKLDDNLWLMEDDELGVFRYTGCPDYDNDKNIWAGYIANRAIWEERGSCKSIRAAGLAFIYERDEHGNAEEISKWEADHRTSQNY
jgi:hypothetical protein